MNFKPDRDLQPIADMEKVRVILRNHLMGRPLYIKGSEPPVELKLIGFVDESRNIVVLDPGRYRVEPGEVTLYQVLGRYVELHCKVIKIHEKTGQLAVGVLAAYIAQKQRGSIRIPIKGDEVYINNIRCSTGVMDLNPYQIPTTIKVNLNMFEQTIKKRADFVTVTTYDNPEPLVGAVRDEGKPMLISDTTDPETYHPKSSRYFNPAEFLKSEMKKKMEEYRLSRIISDIIYPIQSEDRIPIGFVRMQSRGRRFDSITVADLEKGISSMMKKIRDSNQVFVDERQKVLNVSRGGIKALISHDQLKEFLPRQSGFTFDLIFKMQAPITLYGLIRMTTEDGNGNLILGVQIVGNSDRPGEMNRFTDNVTQMEKAIHDKLARARRRAP